MSDFISPLKVRLKEARLNKDLSQKSLGILIGIDQFSASSRMNHYEVGRHVPDNLTLHKISNVLDVPLAYFYCENDLMAKLLIAIHQKNIKDAQQLFKDLINIDNSTD